MCESIEINEGNGELKMREINFRAWDLGAEQMYDWESIKLHFSEHVDHEMVVVMQYTGLKDKNGNGDCEVYEGDIITIEGKIGGNIYENEPRRTDIVIPSIGTKAWESSYKKAVDRGFDYAE